MWKPKEHNRLISNMSPRLRLWMTTWKVFICKLDSLNECDFISPDISWGQWRERIRALPREPASTVRMCWNPSPPAHRINHHSNRQPMVLSGNPGPGRDGQHAGLEPSFPPPKVKVGLTWTVCSLKNHFILKYCPSAYLSKPFMVRVDLLINPV